MVLYEKIRNGRKICVTCTGYVQGKQNSNEVCNRNYRKFQGQGQIAPGSALNLFLFAVTIDRLMNKVRREPPWTMLFADDIVICRDKGRSKADTRMLEVCIGKKRDESKVKDQISVHK